MSTTDGNPTTPQQAGQSRAEDPDGGGMTPHPLSDDRCARFPVKLNDNYTCQGMDADGRYVVYGDLLSEGERVAAMDDGEGSSWGPYGVVVRKADGLWIFAEGEAWPVQLSERPEERT